MLADLGDAFDGFNRCHQVAKVIAGLYLGEASGLLKLSDPLGKTNDEFMNFSELFLKRA